jgi:hypothetical protein
MLGIGRSPASQLENWERSMTPERSEVIEVRMISKLNRALSDLILLELSDCIHATMIRRLAPGPSRNGPCSG